MVDTSADDLRHDCVSRLLALDRQYLLDRLSTEEYQTQVADILARLDR